MDSSQRGRGRLEVYFASCNAGDDAEIAAHFTPDAVVWDANTRPARGPDEIAQAAFMGRVGIGMKQADRDRLRAAFVKLCQ